MSGPKFRKGDIVVPKVPPFAGQECRVTKVYDVTGTTYKHAVRVATPDEPWTQERNADNMTLLRRPVRPGDEVRHVPTGRRDMAAGPWRSPTPDWVHADGTPIDFDVPTDPPKPDTSTSQLARYRAQQEADFAQASQAYQDHAVKTASAVIQAARELAGVDTAFLREPAPEAVEVRSVRTAASADFVSGEAYVAAKREAATLRDQLVPLRDQIARLTHDVTSLQAELYRKDREIARLKRGGR